jgi:hypothetical protein
MTRANNPLDSEPDPGEPRFESPDEVIHDFYSDHGPEMLRELLNNWVPNLSREELEECAPKLQAAGKPSIAAIALEIAADKPSGIDIGNPYEEGTLNWSEWRKGWLRRRRMRTGKFETDPGLKEAKKAKNKPKP